MLATILIIILCAWMALGLAMRRNNRRHDARATTARQFLSGTWDHATDSQPVCDDCGILVTVGAATDGRWRCRNCRVIHDFTV